MKSWIAGISHIVHVVSLQRAPTHFGAFCATRWCKYCHKDAFMECYASFPPRCEKDSIVETLMRKNYHFSIFYDTILPSVSVVQVKFQDTLKFNQINF